jgi:phosphoserine phosphatase
VAIADRIRETSLEAVRVLQEAGVEVVMLTGDNRHTAAAIAGQAGITRFAAEVLPQNKAEEVRRLQGEGHVVGMAGDGINDAPALAQADVSFAIGGDRTSRSRRPMSFWSATICAGFRRRSACRARRWPRSARTCSLLSSTTCWAFTRRVRHAQSGDRRGRHGDEFDLGGEQFPVAQPVETALMGPAMR